MDHDWNAYVVMMQSVHPSPQVFGIHPTWIHQIDGEHELKSVMPVARFCFSQANMTRGLTVVRSNIRKVPFVFLYETLLVISSSVSINLYAMYLVEL